MNTPSPRIKFCFFLVLAPIFLGHTGQTVQTQQQRRMQAQSTADKILADTLFFPQSFVKQLRSLASMSPSVMLRVPDEHQPSIDDIVKKYGKADVETKTSRDKLFNYAPRGANEDVENFLLYEYGNFTFVVPEDKSERKVAYVRWKEPEPITIQDQKPSPLWSDKDYQTALTFFEGGGSWAIRLVAGANADREQKWTILILGPANSQKKSYTLGVADLGQKSTVASAMKVTDLLNAPPPTLKEFLRRYAEHVGPGALTARLMLTTPIKGSKPINAQAAVTLTKKGLLDLVK
jgi:hypothetical protein